MKEAFEKSLHMIKVLGVKSEKEYNSLLKDYALLSSESMKYIAQTRNFDYMIKMASL